MQSTCPILERNGYFFSKLPAIWLNSFTLGKPWSKTVVLKVSSGPAASKSPENLDMQIFESHSSPIQLETLGIGARQA